MQVFHFSQGKIPERNEDAFGRNETTFVVADGVTSKDRQLPHAQQPDERHHVGVKTYNRRTGGEYASQSVVATCLASKNYGELLVAECNAALDKVMQELDPSITEDPKKRFAATLVCAKILDRSLIVTRVGDTDFRVNGLRDWKATLLVGELAANLRSEYIKATEDTEGARAYIEPLLLVQHQYRNNPESPLGYGAIDGTQTPKKFVEVFSFAFETVQILEIFTDGYFAVPRGSSIKDWEAQHERVEKIDPQKCLRYKSTKANDDRTVLIVEF